ncbi:phage tail protein [Humibacter ginsenosidimutans]|uniref:Phage tail protein n=1 Tax=Humibacter ginsenosidimutans TaxID=2599293 RepID=A0A5B8M5T6_9MICO|nr:tail fiber protein [Humibacter ginsenosidimutans]QDZ15314.1 phage tail protein [Humibacter ginsenosidimutans]
MSDPYVGEIRMFAGNFAPVGWAFCNGQSVPISENETLFQLIGTTYGGDGVNTFALPDLQGRAPVHVGSSVALGQQGGVEEVTLTTSQIPSHTHIPQGTTAQAATGDPSNAVWASWGDNPYSSSTPAAALAASAIGAAGGSQPHDNMPPYQVINFIISLYGIFPSPS